MFSGRNRRDHRHPHPHTRVYPLEINTHIESQCHLLGKTKTSQLCAALASDAGRRKPRWRSKSGAVATTPRWVREDGSWRVAPPTDCERLRFFELRVRTLRPEDACQKRFSWFFNFFSWIRKVQTCVSLVDIVKGFQATGTCKFGRRYSRQRASQSLPKSSQR